MEPNIQQQKPENLTPPVQQKSSGIGPLIAIVIILLLIIAGGLYFWLNRASETQAPEEVTQEQPDQFEEIEADLNTDEFSDIESDLESIDQEF